MQVAGPGANGITSGELGCAAGVDGGIARGGARFAPFWTDSKGGDGNLRSFQLCDCKQSKLWIAVVVGRWRVFVCKASCVVQNFRCQSGKYRCQGKTWFASSRVLSILIARIPGATGLCNFPFILTSPPAGNHSQKCVCVKLLPLASRQSDLWEGALSRATSRM